MKKYRWIIALVVFILVFFSITTCIKWVMRRELEEMIWAADFALVNEYTVWLYYGDVAEVIDVKIPIVEFVELGVVELISLTGAIYMTVSNRKYRERMRLKKISLN